MYRLLLFFTLLFSSSLFAETLTPGMISQIHDQVKNSFFNGCSKNLTGQGVEICRCLANKTESNLDDTALSKCNNDESGKNCVTNIVKTASIKATTQDNITDCKQKIAEGQNSTTLVGNANPAIPSNPSAAPINNNVPSTPNAAPTIPNNVAPTTPSPSVPNNVAPNTPPPPVNNNAAPPGNNNPGMASPSNNNTTSGM